MASAATQSPRFTLPEPAIPADAAERLAVARKAWLDLKSAEANVQRIDSILREGDFAARRNGVTRADQYTAWQRQTDAESLLVRALGAE